MKSNCEQKAPYIKKAWERVRQVSEVGTESKTDTSFGNDTDINKIVERFARTGQLPEATSPPQFADVTNLQVDLTQLMEQTRNARKELEKLQSEADAKRKEQAEADAKELAELRAYKAANIEQANSE